MKKSDRKRQAILEAAYRLFLEKGFERTSMSEINAVVGGSKATIYNHFPSKEALFVECLFSPIDTGMDGILGFLQENSGDDVVAVLRRFSRDYLRLVCSPEAISIRRLMIAEAARAGVGKMFHDKLQVTARRVEGHLAELMSRGMLRPADPKLAAQQLRMLVEAELVEPLLLCATDGPPGEVTIVASADAAVEAFLAAYASSNMAPAAS